MARCRHSSFLHVVVLSNFYVTSSCDVPLANEANEGTVLKRWLKTVKCLLFPEQANHVLITKRAMKLYCTA